MSAKIKQHPAFPFWQMLYLTIFVLFSAAVLYFVFMEKPHDEALYAKLLAGESEKNNADAAGQTRVSTRRDLLFTKEGKRLELRAESASGVFVLKDSGPVEEMQGVLVVMQESIQDEVQKVQVWRSDSAIYNYGRRELSLADVTFSLYEIPGTSLPDDFTKSPPLIRGSASSAELTLQDGFPSMTMKEFRAWIK